MSFIIKTHAIEPNTHVVDPFGCFILITAEFVVPHAKEFLDKSLFVLDQRHPVFLPLALGLKDPVICSVSNASHVL